MLPTCTSVEYDFCIKGNDECFHIMGTTLAQP